MARQIRKLRAHFNEPYVKTDRIRSHSARHRAINDLKASGIDREVGKQFARISDDAVWAGYGRLSAVLSPGPGSEESRSRTHADNVHCWGFGDSGWSDIISLGFSSLPFHTLSSHALQDQLSLIRQTFFHEHSSDAGSGRAGPVDSSATARAQKAFAVSRLESRNKISKPKPHALNPKNL